MQRVFLLLEVEEERGSGRERVREGGGRTGSEAEGVALLLRLTFSRHPDNMKTPSVSLLLGVSVLLLSGLTVSADDVTVRHTANRRDKRSAAEDTVYAGQHHSCISSVLAWMDTLDVESLS
ncbi:uncharacterized protein AKAME5_002503700, partial [Lates japonicus]